MFRENTFKTTNTPSHPQPLSIYCGVDLKMEHEFSSTNGFSSTHGFVCEMKFNFRAYQYQIHHKMQWQSSTKIKEKSISDFILIGKFTES